MATIGCTGRSNHARADAEKIDVGVAAPQPLEQEAICYLIAEKAREGKTVARLKWGDPFVFDRGGAEALFLHEQGVRFEVVPGIPAGIAVPTYAGVPTTYPGGGDTLTLVRGHENEGRARPSVDWASLARLDGTIVCYAGPDQLPEVLAALMSHGRRPDETAAIVYDGTLPTQETRIGSLDELARATRESGDRRPAMLIVGRVVGLREHLRWFDARPLFGKRVLVTRPRGAGGRSRRTARSDGRGGDRSADGSHRAARRLRTARRGLRERRDVRLDHLRERDGRRHVRRAIAPDAARSPHPQRREAVRRRPGDAARLTRYGLKVDLMPSEFRAEAVMGAIAGVTDVRALKILLPHADIGRELLAVELRKQGAEVTEVVAYRTVIAEPERDGEPDIYRMLLDRRIDVVTFTSASAVHGFVKAVGAEPAADLLRTTVVATIGPVTAEAAAQCHIHATIVPAHSTVPALVDAIVAHFAKP